MDPFYVYSAIEFSADGYYVTTEVEWNEITIDGETFPGGHSKGTTHIGQYYVTPDGTHHFGTYVYKDGVLSQGNSVATYTRVN